MLFFLVLAIEDLLVQALQEELVVGGPRWVSQWATLAASHIRTDPEGSGGESHIMVTEDRGTLNLNIEDAKILVCQLI